jgi:lysophospholipase L1-like esterase
MIFGQRQKLGAVIAMLAAMGGLVAQDQVNITLLGDSLMATQAEGNRIQGWGKFLGSHFVNANVTNLALSGRSTKTFLKEANWEKALNTPSTVWLIAFGTNDSHPPEKPEHASPEDYAKNLTMMVGEAKSRKIQPVLLTPPHRRLNAKGQLTNELQPYVDALRGVATKENVKVIDLYGFTGSWYSQSGLEAIAPFVPPDLGGHFSQAGAEHVAAEVARQLAELDSVLVLKDPSPNQDPAQPSPTP